MLPHGSQDAGRTFWRIILNVTTAPPICNVIHQSPPQICNVLDQSRAFITQALVIRPMIMFTLLLAKSCFDEITVCDNQLLFKIYFLISLLTLVYNIYEIVLVLFVSFSNYLPCDSMFFNSLNLVYFRTFRQLH